MKNIKIEVISGKFGPCLAIGTEGGVTRVAGPKTCGGGTTLHSFDVNIAELRSVLDEYEKDEDEPKCPNCGRPEEFTGGPDYCPCEDDDGDVGF